MTLSLSDAARDELRRVLGTVAACAPDCMPIDLSGREIQLGSPSPSPLLPDGVPDEWRVMAPLVQGRSFGDAACALWASEPTPPLHCVFQVGWVNTKINTIQDENTWCVKTGSGLEYDDWDPSPHDPQPSEHQLDEWMYRAARDFKPSLQPYIWMKASTTSPSASASSSSSLRSFLWLAYPRRQAWIQGTLPPVTTADRQQPPADDKPAIGLAQWNALWLTPQDKLLREASTWTQPTLDQLNHWSNYGCDTHYAERVVAALLEPFRGSIDELRRQAKLAYLLNRLWNQPLPSSIARLFPLEQLLHQLHPTTRLQRIPSIDQDQGTQDHDGDPRRWQDALIRYPVFLSYIRARGWTLPRHVDRLSQLCPWFVRLMTSATVRYVVTGSTDGKQVPSSLEIKSLTISPCNDGPVTQCPNTLQTIHAFLCLSYVPPGSSIPVSFWIPSPDMLRLTGRHDDEAKLIETWCRLLLQQPDQRPLLLGVLEAQQTATYDLKSNRLVIRLQQQKQQQDRAKSGVMATWMPQYEASDASSSTRLPRLANPVQDWLLPDKWFMYLFRDRTDAEQLRHVVHLLFVMMTKTGEGQPRALDDAQRWYTDMEDRMNKRRLTWDRLAREFLLQYPGMSDWWSDLMRARRFVAQLPEDDKDPWDPKLLSAWVQRARASLEASPFQFCLPPSSSFSSSSSSSLSSSSSESSMGTVESLDSVQLQALGTRLPSCQPSPPFTFQVNAKDLWSDIDALSKSLSETDLKSSPSSPPSSSVLPSSPSHAGNASRKRKAPSSSPPDSPDSHALLPRERPRSIQPSAAKRPRLDAEVIVIPDSDSDEE